MLQTMGSTAAIAQLQLPGISQTPAGLPGMLKSWAVESGASVLAQQQQDGGKTVLQLAQADGTRQPAFTEQESRCVVKAAWYFVGARRGERWCQA